MLKLQGRDIYLATLERGDCLEIYRQFEYDFSNPTEILNIGYSNEGADKWFDDIQRLQGNTNVRLGIFLNDGTVIGDIALQDIDRFNRSCSIGMGMTALNYRGKGYGSQAVALILDYAFNNFGLHRVTANTLDVNAAARRSLEKAGFKLEGIEREAVWLCGAYHDRYNYALLDREFIATLNKKED